MRAAAISSLALASVLALGAAGCRSDLEDPGQLATPDPHYFRCRVQPVLTKYCSMGACHGTEERFFTVYARNRLRIDEAISEQNVFMASQEREFNYLSAVTMLDAEEPASSWLLLKPLEAEAGGYFHVATQTLGEPGSPDVFASADDPEYRVLVEWANGATEDPSCIEPASDR